MSHPWFRVYSELVDDRKLTRTARETGLSRMAVLGAWTGLLCLANDSPERGRLLLTETAPLTLAEIAETMGTDTNELDPIITAFVGLGMVTWDGDVLCLADCGKYLAPEVRPQSAVAAWRAAVFARDDYTCQDCRRRGGKLHAHHIRPWYAWPADRFDVANGVTLCRKCHSKRHGKGWKRQHGR